MVAASGEIDVLTIGDLRQELSSTDESDALVIDLRETDYIDSAGLELLVSVYARRAKSGKRLAVLIREGSQPDTVLHIVQLHSLTMVTSDPRRAGLET